MHMLSISDGEKRPVCRSDAAPAQPREGKTSSGDNAGLAQPGIESRVSEGGWASTSRSEK